MLPKDTKGNPEITLKVAKELRDNDVQIVIGPLFYKNLIYLDELNQMIFLTLSK